MKSNVIVPIFNTREAAAKVKELQTRPKADVPGLACMYGCPGLGKSYWSESYASQNNHIWIRMKEAETAKGFMSRLLKRLVYRDEGQNRNISGSTDEIYKECEEILQRNPDWVVFIDEVDRALGGRKTKVLEMIRDLADCTYASYILIGMEHLRRLIQKYSAHYFDRCYFFYEFRPATSEEMKAIIEAKIDYSASDKVVQATMEKSGGTLRKSIKLMVDMEEARNVRRNSQK